MDHEPSNQMPGDPSTAYSIPFSRTHVTGRELDYIQKVISSGKIAGPGEYSKACEAHICGTTAARSAFLVPSCTAALEMCAMLLDLGPGDEVIMPSFTFVSNSNAVVLRGAVPVFADVDPVTFNLAPDQIEAAMTSKTRAIFVTHYAGVTAPMPEICRLAESRGVYLVEDAAQAYGSSLQGRPAGSFAPLSCFSFHGTKNVSAGEAGALVVNDPQLIDRSAILREKGTDRTSFLAGEVSTYTWQDIGSSYVVSELAAAFLLAQLEDMAEITARRSRLWRNYHEGLFDLASTKTFQLPNPPTDNIHNSHLFFLVLPDRSARMSLSAFLNSKGIASATHYVPLDASPAGKRYGRVSGDLRETRRAAECLLRLPLYPGLEEHQPFIIEMVRQWVTIQK